MTIQTSSPWAEIDCQGNIIELHSESMTLTVSNDIRLTNGNYVYYENVVTEL